jgi:hypothetical protein
MTMDAARNAPGRVGLAILAVLLCLVVMLRIATSSKRARKAERRQD